MRLSTVHNLLKLWMKAGLINDDQTASIMDYMKTRRRNTFFRLVKVLFVMGAFWLVIGIVATLKLIDVKILAKIWSFIGKLFSPLVTFSKWIAGENYGLFLGGIGCVAGWALLQWLGGRLRKASSMEMVKLGFLADSDLRLGTTSLTIGYILAAASFQIFNYLLYPPHSSIGYDHGNRIVLVPYFSFIAIAFFLYLAYRMKDQIALLFGIGFISQAAGLFTAYFFACYMIGVQLPVIQALVGTLLVFVGLWHVEKARDNEESFTGIFGRTYQAAGLLFIFLSLWVMSLWGITYRESYWMHPPAFELWVANLLFLAGCLAALFIGAASEDRMYFNFGLTFFIIDTYTLFFSYVWASAGTAFGSLLLGSLLVGTGYGLRKLFLKKVIP